MDDTGGLILWAGAIGATIMFFIIFSIGWFVVYVTLGCWLKVWLIHLRLDSSSGIGKRYGPVIVSHIFYSVLFVNPWILFYSGWDLDIGSAGRGSIFSSL